MYRDHVNLKKLSLLVICYNVSLFFKKYLKTYFYYLVNVPVISSDDELDGIEGFSDSDDESIMHNVEKMDFPDLVRCFFCYNNASIFIIIL